MGGRRLSLYLEQAYSKSATVADLEGMACHIG